MKRKKRKKLQDLPNPTLEDKLENLSLKEVMKDEELSKEFADFYNEKYLPLTDKEGKYFIDNPFFKFSVKEFKKCKNRKWITVALTVFAVIGVSVLFAFGLIVWRSPWLIGHSDNGERPPFSYNNKFLKLTDYVNTDPDAAKANTFIDNNVSSLLIANESKQDRVMGTAWAFPSPANPTTGDMRYFFITNVHVIVPFLDIVDNRYQLLPYTSFFTNRDKDNNLLLSNNKGVYQKRLSDVKLEAIGLKYNKEIVVPTVGKQKFTFNDYAILSTLTNPFGKKIQNFSWATVNEIKRVVTNKEPIYLGGYPANNYLHVDQRNPFNYIKVKVDSNKVDPSLDMNPSIFTSPNNSNIGLAFDNKIWKNDSFSIFFNDFSGGEGSSGSPVFAVIDGKIKILGIYWGILFAGNILKAGIDCLVADPVVFESQNPYATSYDNTKLNPETLYFDKDKK